ncbi:MAG: hypothetical protein IJP35_04350, partial [Clostridia bacterium]|nr:hypothetical protein [Clostridia bacterium]
RSVCGAQKLQRLVAPATFDRGTNCVLPASATGGGRTRYQISLLKPSGVPLGRRTKETVLSETNGYGVLQ